jgi:hypothetical protein
MGLPPGKQKPGTVAARWDAVLFQNAARRTHRRRRLDSVVLKPSTDYLHDPLRVGDDHLGLGRILRVLTSIQSAMRPNYGCGIMSWMW